MRQYLPGGQRGPWIGQIEGTRPFERADGSVMSEEEIKALASTDASVFKKHTGRTPIDADAVWKAVERTGLQTAAARELGLSQGAVQSALKRYMREHELKGPLPGLLPHRPATNGADATPMGAAQMADFLKGASEPSTPEIELVIHHGDPDARAAAFNEGYDKAIEDYTPPKAIDALIDWLTENGPHWTQAEAERWFKAFTATVDLVYPTRDA